MHALARGESEHGSGGRRRNGARLACVAALAGLIYAGAGAAQERAGTRQRPPAAKAPGANGDPGPPQPVLRGDGLWLGGQCFTTCGFPEHTDPDANGDLDGWGFERQRTCIILGTSAALSAPPCDVVPLPNTPPPGDGVFREGTCYARCSSAVTDPDKNGLSDGWGYERRRPCIVSGTAAAFGGLPCDPGLPEYPPGDGVEIAVDAQGKLECR